MEDTIKNFVDRAGCAGGGIEEIMQVLPHRFPMLLVDRCISLVPGESAEGIKAVTFNEPYFEGHLPNRPIVPGVYIIESLMQMINIMILSDKQYESQNVYYAKIAKAKFYERVRPGCLMRLKVEKKGRIDSLITCKAAAYVEGKEVFTGEITAMVSRE